MNLLEIHLLHQRLSVGIKEGMQAITRSAAEAAMYGRVSNKLTQRITREPSYSRGSICQLRDGHINDIANRSIIHSIMMSGYTLAALRRARECFMAIRK